MDAFTLSELVHMSLSLRDIALGFYSQDEEVVPLPNVNTAIVKKVIQRAYTTSQVLLDVTCKTVANMIKGKAPEEIRKSVEEQMRKENKWCEEK